MYRKGGKFLFCIWLPFIYDTRDDVINKLMMGVRIIDRWYPLPPPPEQLLSTSNIKELCNLGEYLYYAYKHRTLNVNNQHWLCTFCISLSCCI